MTRNSKAEKTQSFLHLDMRFINMIYNNGRIFLIDAENCEFGDPLYELAVIDISDNLTLDFWAGYESISNKPDIESDLFYLYKMERQALVLDVFLNVVKTEEELTRKYLAAFKQIKRRLLSVGRQHDAID
jgi:aminoglycoside phosphotransferase (APT) family kinase protein